MVNTQKLYCGILVIIKRAYVARSSQATELIILVTE